MKLAVGFITYNDLTAKYLPSFWTSLKSALAYSGVAYKILVADNSELRANANATWFKSLESDTEFTWNQENLGFARAYNRLLGRARELEAEYFLVINPDTILEKQSLSELIKALDENPGLASVSPKVLSLGSEKIDTLGLILKPGLRFFDYAQGKLFPSGAQEIIGPSGAAGLFRLKALEKIRENGHYYDENMFMYKEDCDLAYRLFLAGYKSQTVFDALVYHDRSVRVIKSGLFGIIKNRQTKSRQVRIWSFRNQNLIWKKYWSRQNFKNKIIIFFYFTLSQIWALLFERFLFNNSKKTIN